MSNEIQLYEKVSDPVGGIMKLGEALGKSAILGFTKAEQGIVLAWECFATRKSPMQIVRRVHITERGQIQMRSDAMLAGFREIGGRVKWVKHSPEVVEGEFSFEEQKTLISFTIAEARAAGYIRAKSAWETRPEMMLMAACIRKAIRMLAPEVIVESGDPDGEAQQGAPMTMPATAAVSAPETPVKPEPTNAPVIDVESVATVATAPVATPPTAAPIATREPVTAAGFPLNRRPDRINEPIKPDTLMKLEGVIGDIAIQALTFLRSDKTPDKGPWIGPDEGFEHLSEKDANRILDKVAGFKSKVLQ